MSDSDDTDVLLLIPPDLFVVPSSSNSDADSVTCERTNYSSGRNGVISELVEHMQSLESRLHAIESRDNSLDVSFLNTSLDFQAQGKTCVKNKQISARDRLSVSQHSSLQTTPVKPCKSLSVPSTPSSYLPSNRTNTIRNEMRLGRCLAGADKANGAVTNLCTPKKHDTALTSKSNTSMVSTTSRSKGIPHANAISPKRESYLSLPIDYHANTSIPYHKTGGQLRSTKSASNLSATVREAQSSSKAVQDMELSEVDELLQEMEATELELSKRINDTCSYQYHQGIRKPSLPLVEDTGAIKSLDQDGAYGDTTPSRRLDFEQDNKQLPYSVGQLNKFQKKDTFADISLPYNDSFQLDETDKMVSEFRTWEQSNQSLPQKKEEHTVGISNFKQTADDLSEASAIKVAVSQNNMLENERNSSIEDNVGGAGVNAAHSYQPSSFKKIETALVSEIAQFHAALPVRRSNYCRETLSDFSKLPQYSLHDSNGDRKEALPPKSTLHVGTNTEPNIRKSQRLLSLSDFWDTNMNKSQEEMLRIKLEEEKFRREHCEHLIQELQKRLLEQQEKVAVAIRVDNEKNVLISQFHSAWTKLKQRVQVLETEHRDLQANMKIVTEKHQSEVLEFQGQIKRCESELSKALDLAAGYKEKSDSMIKEKVELLKAHADELETYKSLVQEAENRYEQTKGEYNKLLEKNLQTEEALRNVQQELNRERLRGGEVRNEMGVIHKALDACEAELTVLKQEKESLQLKLKEEVNRNTILEQRNGSLLASVDEARKAEKMAKDETKSVSEQGEKIRAELQEVYQKQVDEVVKAKLQEFQNQLDSAESEFLEELKTRQQVIAECAARKIKEVIDKHRLEINLLEEKHKEEKRLCELQLAQVVQKSSMLETRLNSQRATKSQLAEQLHSVMQKQWQQALQIISGGNLDNLTPIQRIHAEKFFESAGPRKSESMPDCYTKIAHEPIKLPTKSFDTQHYHRSRHCEQQNESFITITSTEETPVTSRKESKDDLRKYIKMIAEMQQAREEAKYNEDSPSPPPVCREVPRKHYVKKELSVANEDSVSWQPIAETSAHDISEYMSIPQKGTSKMDQQRNKPPWK